MFIYFNWLVMLFFCTSEIFCTICIVSVMVYLICIWNALPIDIKYCGSLSVFRKELQLDKCHVQNTLLVTVLIFNHI